MPVQGAKISKLRPSGSPSARPAITMSTEVAAPTPATTIVHAEYLFRKGLGIVGRLVAERAAGLEIPPAARVRGDPVDDRVSEARGTQAGVDEPRGVVGTQPRREHARTARAIVARSDAQAH